MKKKNATCFSFLLSFIHTFFMYILGKLQFIRAKEKRNLKEVYIFFNKKTTYIEK